MVKYFPMREIIKAPELADLFIAKIITQYKSPESIITDRGSLFTSEYWSMFCYSLMICKKLSTVYHPQTDSETEWQSQTLENYLCAYINYLQDDWVSLLPTAEFAYNNSFNATIKGTPFKMLMEYDPTIETMVKDANMKEGILHMKECMEYLSHIRNKMVACWTEAVKSQAKFHNKRYINKEFKVGQKVWLSMKNIQTQQPHKKLEHHYTSPFSIVKQVGKQAYHLELPQYYRIHLVFNVTLLEPYKKWPGEIPGHPPPIRVDEENECEVE